MCIRDRRSVEEPDQDKVLRGSRDGFVETLVMNTALIRRRIRNPDLTVKIFSVGSLSKTDVAVCYMNSVVDHKLLDRITKKIQSVQVEALTTVSYTHLDVYKRQHLSCFC